MEVLLGLGEIQGVLTVLVSGVEIPVGVSGTDMTGTGWYNGQTPGTRSAARGRSVWQHGVRFGGGAKPDQQRNGSPQGNGAGAGAETARIWSGRQLH